jgi:hypothetical protein
VSGRAVIRACDGSGVVVSAVIIPRGSKIECELFFSGPFLSALHEKLQTLSENLISRARDENIVPVAFITQLWDETSEGSMDS